MIKTVLLLTTALLVGCVSVPDAPREYAPQPHDAQLEFRVLNMPMPAEFALNHEPQGCEGFRRVGLVRDSGRSVLLPWIASLTSKFNKVPTELGASVPPDQVIQVKGYGTWNQGRCGPLVAKFPVASQSRYVVDFVWHESTACSMRVAESVGGELKPVQFERGYCKR